MSKGKLQVVADRGAKSNEKGCPMIPWKKESCMKKTKVLTDEIRKLYTP